MLRRLLVPATLSIAVASCGGGDDGGAAPVDDRPSVLWITVDTLRWDALGCTGGPVPTPHLDALAADGLLFDHARSHVPLTLPSHGTLFGGRLPPALGVHDNAPFSIGDHVPLVTEVFADEGYTTGAVVAGQPLKRGCGLERGFATYAEPDAARSGSTLFGELRADAVTDRALAWLDEATGARFLWLHYFDPHYPYSPPRAFADGTASPRERYHGEVQFVDAQVGRVLERLEADGRRWLVAVTSDHGEGLGDDGEWTHGYQVFDATQRVPLIVSEVMGSLRKAPDALATMPPSSRVQLADLAPTCLRLVDLPALPGATGRDWTEEAAPAAPAYVESLAAHLQFGWAQTTGVRTDDGLLLWSGDAEPAAPWISPEPGEWFLPLRGQPAPAAETLEAARATLRQARAEESEARSSFDTSAALEAIGYLVGSSDEDRHRLLPREANDSLPSPVVRMETIQRFLRAIQRASEGESKEAAETLRTVLEQDPTNPAAQFYLGRILLQTGVRTDALRAAGHFARALELDSSFRGAGALRAKALGLGGDFGAALDLAETLVRETPGPTSKRLLGSLLVTPHAGGIPNRGLDEPRGYTLLVESLEEATDVGMVRNVSTALVGFRPAPWADALITRLQALEDRRAP